MPTGARATYSCTRTGRDETPFRAAPRRPPRGWGAQCPGGGGGHRSGGFPLPSRKRQRISDDEGDLGGDLGYTYVRVRGWLSTLMLGT